MSIMFSRRLMLFVVVGLSAALAASLKASDLTLTTPVSFGSLDGSPSDDDGITNGILTVNGNLTIATGGALSGEIDCNDPTSPSGASACPITIVVGTNFDVQADGGIFAEDRTDGGSGANITITAGGNVTLHGPSGSHPGAEISASKISGAGDSGQAGDITITAGGSVLLEPGSLIAADSTGSAGKIVMTAGGNADIDGTVESASTLSGTGAKQAPGGGPITIVAHCDLEISDAGVVSSRGRDPGADLVHLEGCNVNILGLVESTGPGHVVPNSPSNHCDSAFRPGKPSNSTACVECWAGNSLTIDRTAHGEVNADTAQSGGHQIAWIDLFAAGDITIIGGTGTNYAVHANEFVSTSDGGLITVKSTKGGVLTTNSAIQANGAFGAATGGAGGSVTVQASNDVNLTSASIQAKGDVTGGGAAGGHIANRSFNGQVTGSLPGELNASGGPPLGTVTNQGCTAVTYTGTSTPTAVVAPLACGGAPSVPSYVQLPDCTGCAPEIQCSDNISTGFCGSGSIAITYPPPNVTTGVFPVVSSGCSPASGSLFPVGDTIVTCSATDSVGNVATCAFTVHVEAFPVPSCSVTPSNATVCAGLSASFTVNISGGTPPYSVFWNGPGGFTSTSGSIVVSVAGTYTATVTDTNGCSTQCAGTLGVNPNPSCAVVPASTNICDGGSASFCAVPSGGTPPYSFVWSSGEFTPCITKSVAGTYTVTVTDSNGCSTQCAGTLGVNPNPSCAVSPASTNICQGGSAQFCATASGGTGPYAFLWNTGDTTPCITVSSAGTYTVTVTDANGCSSTQCSGSLVVNQNPTCSLSAPNPPPACGSSGNTLSGPGGFAAYSWIIISSDPGWLITGGANSQTVTYTAGNSGTATFQLTVTDANGCSGTCQVTFGCSGCQWCTKSAVQSQVTQNVGTCSAQPDIIVDVRLGTSAIITNNVGTPQPATGSLQAAIDYINAHGDVNGDGFLFIGVIAQDCTSTVGTGQCLAAGTVGRPLGGPAGTENVIITNSRPQRLNVFGCSVTLQAKDPTKPVITVRDSVGKVTVLDIHVTGSSVAGYFVTNNADLVVIKNARALNNDIGYLVNDTDVEITGAPEISGNRIGIQIGGSNVTLRTNSDIRKNSQFGILVLGNGNELNGNEVGVSGFPNGVGEKIAGNGNNVHDDNVAYNTNEGIIVSGNNNTLHGEDSESNGSDGIKVTGAGNLLDSNRTVQKNGANGINADSANGASGNMLKGNQTDNNTLQGTRACGQIDQGGNTAQNNGADPQIAFACSSGPAAFYVPDSGTDKVYKYDASGIGLGSFALGGANGSPSDAAAAGSFVYVLDSSTKSVFRYTSSGGVPVVSKTLKDNTGSSLGTPNGLAIDGDQMWVADENKKKLFRYSLAGAFSGSGSTNALQVIAFTGSNGNCQGVAIDATYLYVLDENDKQLYRYPRAGGSGTASKVIKQSTAAGCGNLNSPSAALLSGISVWVADQGLDKVYQYSLSSLFSGSGNLCATSEFILMQGNAKAEGL